MTMDREGSVPPYRQIAGMLRVRIEDGSIPAGRHIPSLVDLEAGCGAARDTLPFLGAAMVEGPPMKTI